MQPPPPRFVGTVHLPALPGSARGGRASDLAAILDRARRDAATYAEGGASALIVENFGDVPFARSRVGAHVVAAMTLAVEAVLTETGLPVGVNVLRNDVVSAVSIAAMTGARFVRANIYVGAAVTDQGVIEGHADEVQALIRHLGAEVSVWADVDVKHAAPLAPRPIADLAEDAIERGLAGAVIVTGRATGQPVAETDLRDVRARIGDSPLYVGSGVTAETVGSLLQIADGVVVGTAAKVDGIVTNVVDLQRVRAIAHALR
jgi:membrane complex biogenesis BtpA family protein